MCHLHLEAVAVNQHQAVKGALHAGETDNWLQKQNQSFRETAGTLGVAKSTVWYIPRKKEHTGELSNIKRSGRPQKITVVDDLRILFIRKPFHNIQPREEHSPGGRHVTVYNQEKTSESKYRGFTTRCRQGQIRLCQKNI